MIIQHEELVRISEEIWSTVTGLPVVASTSADATALGTEVVTGCVDIVGSWHGTVTVECDVVLARRAAAAMFGIEPDEVADEDLDDAVGELANVAGGNLKALVVGAGGLSLPRVARGADAHTVVPGGRVVERASFVCDGAAWVVTAFDGGADNDAIGQGGEEDTTR